MESYSVIFDNRVANGLIKLSKSSNTYLDMVNINVICKPEAYLKYRDFVFKEAEMINCESDQIEYYLFTL